MISHLHRKWAALAAAFTVATIAACDANDRRAPQPPVPQAAGQGHGRYAFELWEEKLLGGLGCHAIIVVHDRTTDKALLLQGLATNRETGAVKPIGWPWQDNIFVWYQGRDQQSLQADVRLARKASLYQTDDKSDMLARLALMMRAGEQINRKQSPYDVTSRYWFNSNATATTLAEAGGLHIDDVAVDGVAPGLGRSIPITYDGPVRRPAETRQYVAGLTPDQAIPFVTEQADHLSDARDGRQLPDAPVLDLKNISYSANGGLGDTVGLLDFLTGALDKISPKTPAARQPQRQAADPAP